MPTYTLNVDVVGRDQASGPLASVRRALERIGEVALGVTAARSLERLAEGFLSIAGSAVDATAQIQFMQIGLQGLVSRELVQLSDGVKSVSDVFPEAKNRAADLMEQLSQIAIYSPYATEAVNYTFKMAMAFGYSSNEAMSFTKAILNMSAGIGADSSMLERMAYNLAQVRLQGKVTALDVRQLALAGFDLNGVLKDVSKQFGYQIENYKDFNDLVANGSITWQQFTEGFAKYAEQNFGGASERMARSLYGLKSTIQDVFTLTMPQLLGPAAESFTLVANKALDLFTIFRNSGVLTRIGAQWGESISRTLGPTGEFLNQLGIMIDDFLLARKTGTVASEAISGIVGNAKGLPALFEIIRAAIVRTWGESSPMMSAYTISLRFLGILGDIKDAMLNFARGNNKGVIEALGISGPTGTAVLNTLNWITQSFWKLNDAIYYILHGNIGEAFKSLGIPPEVRTSLSNFKKALLLLFQGNGEGVADALGIAGPAGTAIANTINFIALAASRLWDSIKLLFSGDFKGAFDALKISPEVIQGFETLRSIVSSLFQGNAQGVVDALGLTGAPAAAALNVLNLLISGFDAIKLVVSSLAKGDVKGALAALNIPPEVADAVSAVASALGSLLLNAVAYGPQAVAMIGNFVGNLLGISSDDISTGVKTVADNLATFFSNLSTSGPTMLQNLQGLFDKITNEWIPTAQEFIGKFKDEWIPTFLKVGGTVLGVVLPALLALKGVGLAGGMLNAKKSVLDFGTAIADLALKAETAPSWGAILDRTLLRIGAGAGPILATFGPIIGIIVAVAAAVALLAAAWINNWGGIQEKTAAVADTVMTILGPAWESLKTAFASLLPPLQQLWTALQPIIQFLGTTLAVVIGAAVLLLTGLLTGLINGFAQAFSMIAPYLQNVIEGVTSVIDGIVNLFSGIWDVIVGIFTNNGAKVMAGFAQIGQGVTQIVTGMFSVVGNLFMGAFALLIGYVGGFVDGVLSFITDLAVKAFGEDSYIAIQLLALQGFFETAFNGVIDFVSGLIPNFTTIGADIIDGLKEGAKSAWKKFLSWFQGVIDLLPASVKKILGIASPAKRLIPIGKYTIQGITVGAMAESKNLFRTVGKIAGGVVSAATPSLGTTTNNYPTRTQENTIYVNDPLDYTILVRKLKESLAEDF